VDDCASALYVADLEGRAIRRFSTAGADAGKLTGSWDVTGYGKPYAVTPGPYGCAASPLPICRMLAYLSTVPARNTVRSCVASKSACSMSQKLFAIWVLVQNERAPMNRCCQSQLAFMCQVAAGAVLERHWRVRDHPAPRPLRLRCCSKGRPGQTAVGLLLVMLTPGSQL